MPLHTVDARPEHLFYGYFDATTPPVIEIASGDEVALSCLPAGTAASWPEGGVEPVHARVLEAVPRDLGAHMMTGPVAVAGARPGDALRVDILEITPAHDLGFTGVRPLHGALPDRFPGPHVIHVPVDRDAWTCTLPWGSVLPLDPFFGVMAVAPPPDWGRLRSAEPRAFGGNTNLKELRAGATLWLPVFNEGALFSAGDGHGRQGDGEVCLSALEMALDGRFRLTVESGRTLPGPYAETPDHLIAMAFHEDLDEAMRRAVSALTDMVAQRLGIPEIEAYMFLSLCGDLRITQVVDGEKGVHMMIEKAHLARD